MYCEKDGVSGGEGTRGDNGDVPLCQKDRPDRGVRPHCHHCKSLPATI